LAPLYQRESEEDRNSSNNRISDDDIISFSSATLQSLIDEEISAFNELKKDRTTSKQHQKEKLHKPIPSISELLQHFDPQNPPKPDEPLENVQLWLECSAYDESLSKYESILKSAREREDYTSLSTVQRQLLQWYVPLRQRIISEQESYFSGNKSKGANKYGPYLCALQAEKLAIITTHEATMHALKKSSDGSTLMSMALSIGEAVEAEVNVQKLLRSRMERSPKKKADDEVVDESLDPNKKSLEKNIGWMYGASHLQRFVDELNRLDPSRKGKVRIARANRRALQLLQSEKPWSTADKVILGAVLIQMLLETARVDFHGKTKHLVLHEGELESNKYGKPAFVYEKKWVPNKKHLIGHITMNADFYKMVVEDNLASLDIYTTRHKPMVVPPNEWVGPNDGGYKLLKTEFMRAHGCQVQEKALHEGDLSTVMDGLNVLGRVPWVINKSILETAQRCWNEGIVLGDIPSRTDFEVPPQPLRPDGADIDYQSKDGEFAKYREALAKHRRINQKNMDLRSLRCSTLLKLNQANQFKNFDKIYFPYNLDFRGRAYPVPPHLSNIGSDLCRGMLKFSESKPLGPRGLYWLKVHLANLAGNDKITFDDRAAFTDNNMDKVRASVNDPFAGDRWWMGLDDPFQALATCQEIVKAIDSGNPETYECSLPVHMDGSCNGLQHYAALGRDRVGGKAVNLCKYDKPQDVYSGVMEEVIRRVAEDAERVLDFDHSNPEELTKLQREALLSSRAAKLTNGLIDRGVVKRTVMTSVYGVTYIGAKKQIMEKIEDKLAAKGYDVDEMDSEIYAACGYLARVTMDVMGDLFSGARQTMNWLATCARLIASQGQPVAWISPIGVPAVQPYRQKQPYTIVTLLQTVVLLNNNSNLPIHKMRQASAFPPNYVHSLDSSHMLFTALEMDRRGLAFSAVHDSFWTHPCDIDEMNAVLRDSFVDLYSRPLLEELKKTWELQYPSLEFPDLPERGTLDLNEVKQAPYFFQ
jgi:DNA-directed RNA polymerase